MDLLVQLAMAASLSACAGLRAFLPLFAVGLLGRVGVVPLDEAFSFLASTPALVVFGASTAFEVIADKVVAVDHALDAFGTLVRPMAGTVLAAASLHDLDPLPAVVAGLVVGGGTSLTVHAGKAAVRAKSTALSAFHGGLGNAALSFAEDGVTTLGVGMAVALPLLALGFTVAIVVISLLAVRSLVRAGRRVLSTLVRTTPPDVGP